MVKPQLIIPLLLVIFSFKCKPASVDISAHTQVVPALEADIEQGKNIIYAAGFPLVPNLTFSYPMDTVGGGFKFNGQPARSFGRLVYKKYIDREIGIVYFKNDDEFIVTVNVIEQNEEMIFAKGFSQSPRLSVALDSIYAAMEAGRNDTAELSRWKHVFRDFDQVVIPDIRFSLDDDFRKIEGNIESGNEPHEIERAYQRIGLVLSEYGTRSESEVELIEEPTLVIENTDITNVKHMIFNKPFFMILKKSNVRAPYFMMKVENTAFMKKVDY